MRHLLRPATALIVALAFASPAGAILDGKPDTQHPYVGILVTVVDGQRVPVCSGSLIAPTVFLTAAHCVGDIEGLPALVSFDQRYVAASSPVVHGKAVPNPGFGSPGADTHDIAVVLLDSPVTDSGYAQLPALNRLAAVAKKHPLTVVGYGANGFLKGGGHPVPDFRLVRSYGESRVSKVEKSGFNLRMASGICFGDSGGPVLLGSSDVLVGINSFVNNSQCAGNAFGYRVDTAASLAFLAPYLES
jgi:V8-like Glu-specific endopeptidase